MSRPDEETNVNVHDLTYDLMRELQLTTVFGNPGSTEEGFLQNFPQDMTYVLGLQEASVLSMADGFAQATGEPAFVNVHTNVGLGNAMGNLINAKQSKTPLIVTTGQQTREMLLLEPLLTNVDATMLPRPYVKWAYEPARAQDVPGAIMRAYAAAVQPPQGPVYLSLPQDDWEKDGIGATPVRDAAQRVGPDPQLIERFATALTEANKVAVVAGADIDRAGAWDLAVRLAEKTHATVFGAPHSERVSFPEDHPQFAGNLPPAIAALEKKLEGHDLVLVIGAPVFRYYPYEPGNYLPEGCRLLHITDDPEEAARAAVGDSLLSDARLALERLCDAVPQAQRPAPQQSHEQSTPETGSPMSADALFEAVGHVKPDDAVIVQESSSNEKMIHQRMPTRKPLSYIGSASGGLGFGLPASIGVALGERKTGRNRPVLAVIGEGAYQYSVQSLWTAAQHKVPVVVLVPRNDEYAILKAYAEHDKTPDVPGLDLPGLDILGLAKSFGCATYSAGKPDEAADAVSAAFAHDGPTVIEAPIDRAAPPLP
jgi:benzoylformate decarboxylase